MHHIDLSPSVGRYDAKVATNASPQVECSAIAASAYDSSLWEIQAEWPGVHPFSTSSLRPGHLMDQYLAIGTCPESEGGENHDANTREFFHLEPSSEIS